jgi:hypothetical protein
VGVAAPTACITLAGDKTQGTVLENLAAQALPARAGSDAPAQLVGAPPTVWAAALRDQRPPAEAMNPTLAVLRRKLLLLVMNYPWQETSAKP